jgi:toxin CptA
LIAALIFGHGLAVIALGYANIPLALAGLGMCLALANLGWQLQRYFYALPTQLQCVDGQWFVVWRGQQHMIELLPDVVVLSIIIVLRYRMPAGDTRNLVLLPDSALADELRRLRVRLRR